MSADGKPPKRIQSQSERDSQGLAARKERDRASEAAAPFSPGTEELTGNYKGEELERLRSLRPTDLRFAHLEGRVDNAFNELGEIRAEIGEVRGEVDSGLGSVRAEIATGLGKIAGGMGELAGEMKGLARVVEDQGKRHHATFTATLDVDTAAKKAGIEVGAAVQKDEIDAKKEKRTRATKIIAGVIALLTSGTFLGWLLGKL